MRVLVTGGTGFVGGHVVATLVEAGHEVRVLDAVPPATHPGGAPVLPAGVDLIVGDVRDRAVVERALGGVDAVSHQAAKVGLGVDLQDLPDYAARNDLATAVLLAAMARLGVGRLVLASSMVVYGEGRYTCPRHGAVAPGPRTAADLDAGRFEPPCPVCSAPLEPGEVGEDAPVDPRSGYAATKVAQEHLAAAWSHAGAGSVAALRYHNVYGPGMPRDTPYAGVAAIFRSALERGEAPQVFEDGGQRRDFVHVRDVAAANVTALERHAGGFRAFNVATGVPRTVGDMARALAAAYGGPAPVVTGAYRLGDVRHVTASARRAADELGWHAWVSFEEGMRAFARDPLR